MGSLSGSFKHLRTYFGLSHDILSSLSGVYYQDSTIRLTGRDSYLTIKAYNDEPVTISGGILLDNPINDWVIDGQIRTATFPLSSCGELFQGKNRLLPAKSPNVQWGSNKNIASGEYHYMKVRFFIYYTLMRRSCHI